MSTNNNSSSSSANNNTTPSKSTSNNKPHEILSMVKSLASPLHCLLLFFQQSSVELCSSLWLDATRTLSIVSKFDNRLKEFTEKWEVDQYLSANGYLVLGKITHPCFVALLKDRGTIMNDEFRRQIAQVDTEVLRHLRESVSGGFDERKFKPFTGFGRLKDYLEEVQKRYKEAAPATLALLEQCCDEVSIDLASMDSKIRATSDAAHLRRSAMTHAASICCHIGALIDGAADPDPEQWGKTTTEEQSESGMGRWPGLNKDVKPPDSTLKLSGGAAFERVMHEFCCATFIIECPAVSREKVAYILLAHAGRGGGGRLTEAAAEIAHTAARSWLTPLLDTARDRLAYILGNLFELSVERSCSHDSLNHGMRNADMEGYIVFHSSLRHSYNRFIKALAKQCKKLIRHHLDSFTSPYSQVCSEIDFGYGASSMSIGFNQARVSAFCMELATHTDGRDQENIPPERRGGQRAPGKTREAKEILGEKQLSVPETTSPDQPCDVPYAGGKKKEHGNCNDNIVGKKRQSRMTTTSRQVDYNLGQNAGSHLCGNSGISSRSGSAYSYAASTAAQHFAKTREVLIERLLPSTLNSGFLTPWLALALGLDVFSVNDEKLMDMDMDMDMFAARSSEVLLEPYLAFHIL